MPNLASEARIAERFARWLSHETGRQYRVTPGDDPPDFIMQPKGWLEVTDIYLRNEQAKFLNSPAEKSFRFSGPLDETALRLITKLDEKLRKESYQPAYAEHGKGTLLLTCQDDFFDEVNLAQVHQTLASFRPTTIAGFLRSRILNIVYPAQITSMRSFTRERPKQAMQRSARAYVR